MDKIKFENKPSTNTPVSAKNLNLMQDNIEKAIDEIEILPLSKTQDMNNLYSNRGIHFYRSTESDELPHYINFPEGATNDGLLITISGPYSNLRFQIYLQENMGYLGRKGVFLRNNTDSWYLAGAYDPDQGVG